MGRAVRRDRGLAQNGLGPVRSATLYPARRKSKSGCMMNVNVVAIVSVCVPASVCVGVIVGVVAVVSVCVLANVIACATVIVHVFLPPKERQAMQTKDVRIVADLKHTIAVSCLEF